MQRQVMNAEDDRDQKRVKVTMDHHTATRLQNFAERAGLNLSEAGLHFIELGMEKQVALIAARRHAAMLHQKAEEELDAMAEPDEKDAWDR